MDQCTHEVRLQYWKNIILQKGLGVRHKKTSALPSFLSLPYLCVGRGLLRIFGELRILDVRMLSLY